MSLRYTVIRNSKKGTAMRIKKIFYVIWITFILFSMFLIWPLGRIRYTKAVRGYAEEFQYSLELTTMNTIQQEFIPTHNYLQNVVVYFSNIPTEQFTGVMHLNLLDEEGNLLAHDYVRAEDMTEGYHSFCVNAKVQAGRKYSFYIYSEGMELVAPKLVYRTLSVSGPKENGTFYMNGIVFEDSSAAGGYDYGIPLRISQILSYDLFILFMALILKYLFEMCYDRFIKKDTSGIESAE